MTSFIITEIGKKYINRQKDGAALSLYGFVPFISEDKIFNEKSTLNELIVDAVVGDNVYLFNGVQYDLEYNTLKHQDEYDDLVDIVKGEYLYKIKYTNAKFDGESVGVYNLHFGLDDLRVNIDGELDESYEIKSTSLTGVAIFIRKDISVKVTNNNDLELFGVLYFNEGETVNILKNELDWTIAINSNGVYNVESDEASNTFEELRLEETNLTNVYRVESLEIDDKPITFSDVYPENSKTHYYTSGDWSLGFIKGSKNSTNYDLTLINDSSGISGFYFDIDNDTDTLLMNGLNRNSNIIFKNVDDNNTNYSNSLLVSSDVEGENIKSIFNIYSNGEYKNVDKVFAVNSQNNKIVESNGVSVFGNDNDINDAENVFVRGDGNKVLYTKNTYIVGDGNYVKGEDDYIIGNNISSYVDGSVCFGNGYTNNDFAVSYGQSEGNIYGFEKDYGNFVIKGTDDGANIQFSNDSMYLNSEFIKINPSGVKNSLLIDNTNAISENSIVYGQYDTFENTLIKNSISVASAVKSDESGIRKNSTIENSVDVAKEITNVNVKNSLIDNGTVSSTNGLSVENSIIENLMSLGGSVINSLVLDSESEGNVEYKNSIILSNSCTSGTIENSIIQGDTRNNSFKNSHLIGDMPESANGISFENALVVADGNKYVEFHPTYINHNGNMIPYKNALLSNYMDIDTCSGKEWLTTSSMTYSEKIVNELQGQSEFYAKDVGVNQIMFAGRLKDNQNVAVCTLYVDGKDYNFEVTCRFDLNSNNVVFDILDFGYNKEVKSINVAVDLDNLYKKFEFGYDDGKIYVKNLGFGDGLFVTCRFCTCEIITNKNFEFGGTVLSSQLYDRPINSHKIEFNDSNNNFELENNFEVNVKSLTKKSKGQYTLNNLYVDGEKSQLYEDSKSYSYGGSLEKYTHLSDYMSKDYPFKVKIDDKEVIYNGLLDYYYAGGTGFNTNPLLKVTSELVNSNLDLPYNSKYCGLSMSGLLIDDMGFKYISDKGNWEIKNGSTGTDWYFVPSAFKNNLDEDSKYYSISTKDKNTLFDYATLETSNTKKNAILPLDEFIYVTENYCDVFNFTKVVMWGRMVNMSIINSNFGIKNPNGINGLRIARVDEGLMPLTDLKSFTYYNNFGDLSPYNTTYFKLNKNGHLLSLNFTKGSKDRTSIFSIDAKPIDVTLNERNLYTHRTGHSRSGLIKHELTYINGNINFDRTYKDVSLNNKHFKDTIKNINIGEINYIRDGEYYT